MQPSNMGLNAPGSQTPPNDLNVKLHTPWAFLHPTKELHAATLDSAKEYLGPLALSINNHQNSRKRKRSNIAHVNKGQALQIRQLYVEGFTSDQIWEQAKRILDSVGFEAELESILNSRGGGKSTKVQFRQKALGNAVPESRKDYLDDPSRSSTDTSEQDDIDMDNGSQNGDSDSQGWEAGSVDRSSVGRGTDSENSNEIQPDRYKEDPFGLNDGFFSIDDFNKQTELFERQDMRGEPDGDDESDEEIDWHADPLGRDNMASTIKGNPSKVRQRTSDASGSSDEEGQGFGDADLFGGSDSEDDEYAHVDGENDTDWNNTNGIRYSDFFAPPARKASNKEAPLHPAKPQPDESNIEHDMEHAVADTRRDIFEDDISNEEDESDDGSDSGVQHSSHEKHRARITDEIRRLEAANVAKKEWTLAGEVRGADRPVNSLIEEDLEFERIGKPVPVVTNEVSESIEELVKRRILAKEFDEVIRRQPGTMPEGVATKAGKFELDDSRPQKGLAELYEADHLRATDPNYVDVKDQKLAQEHADITNLWTEINSQLDTLSNWHYKPKAPQASINVVTDAPTVSMEDARPAFSSAAGVSETLAPQEIYMPGGDSKFPGEFVTKSGVPVAKDEMSREEKAKWRRLNKEQRRKASERESKPKEGRTAEKQQLVSDLKKGGVKVIGKEGEITGINGNKVQGGENSRNDGGALKL